MTTQAILTSLLCGSLLIGCAPEGTLLDGLIPKASPSASPTANASATQETQAPLPTKAVDPAKIADLEGFKALGCDQESSLKSAHSNTPSKVSFKNASEGKINIYWLNFTGKRVSYKKNLAKGRTHNQATFVTHPWIITNAQDDCLGIYVPEKAENAKLTINDSSQGSSVEVPANLSAVTADNITAERALQGEACLKAKGKTTEAAAVKGLVNVYNQLKPTLGEDLARKGYLGAAAKTLTDSSC